MADRTPVDVILPCLDEADGSLPVSLGEDRTGWWAITAEDADRPGAAGPGAPDAGPDRGSDGPDPAVGGTRAATP
ncbi:hypothetical protein I0C86_05305 [Plantactinospora sp. S1510]|uniref:Uncharacterized protein n=1 Tax=Plantactinospora alkalitolerans TaxID=2789879 RepID=A0ABS0GQE7_9ACTN|nr:hypothetical protein [Plantactinospora alkalitolerans]MBF9128410.1 hypothetical protein [Plantactinospora alkalitolerans]